jgi:hypothetical protein
MPFEQPEKVPNPNEFKQTSQLTSLDVVAQAQTVPADDRTIQKLEKDDASPYPRAIFPGWALVANDIPTKVQLLQSLDADLQDLPGLYMFAEQARKVINEFEPADLEAMGKLVTALQSKDLKQVTAALERYRCNPEGLNNIKQTVPLWLELRGGSEYATGPNKLGPWAGVSNPERFSLYPIVQDGINDDGTPKYTVIERPDYTFLTDDKACRVSYNDASNKTHNLG